MTILDTFLILFKSNSKEVQKETEEAGKSADNFQKKLSESDKTSASLATSLLDVAVNAFAAFATFNTIKSGVIDAANFNAELEKQNRLYGLNAHEIATFDAAVVQAGGHQGEFISWITQYAQKLQEIGQGDKIKNIIPDLKKVSDIMQGMSSDDAQAFGARLGIPPDVVLSLKEGSAALDDVLKKQSELIAVSERSGKAARQFKQDWESSASGIMGFFTDLLSLIQPVLHAIVELFKYLGQSESFNPLLLMRHLSEGKKPATSTSPSTPSDPTVFEVNPYDAGDGRLPRGIRNNNPGNLRSWRDKPTEGGFAKFETLQEGLMAEQKQLSLYGQRGLNTLESIASRWAPSSENNTAAYIAGLSRSTGYKANEPLNMGDPEVLKKVANAINAQENGARFGDLIAAAKTNIAAADQTPLNTATNNTTTNQRTLSIGALNIETQASDPQAVAEAVNKHLNQHYDSVIGNNDDGWEK